MEFLTAKRLENPILKKVFTLNKRPFGKYFDKNVKTPEFDKRRQPMSNMSAPLSPVPSTGHLVLENKKQVNEFIKKSGRKFDYNHKRTASEANMMTPKKMAIKHAMAKKANRLVMDRI